MRISIFLCLVTIGIIVNIGTVSAQATKGQKELPDPASLKWKKARKLGDKLMVKGSTNNAVRYYETAIAKKPEKKDLYQRAADANFILRNYQSANNSYKTAAGFDAEKHKNPYLDFKYALTLKYLGQYEEAAEAFKKFKDIVKDNEKYIELNKQASREILGCRLGIKFRDSVDVPEFKVQHLDENINQAFTDYAPFVLNNNTLFYGAWTSDSVALVDKVERYTVYSRIYVSKKENDKWSKGEPVSGGINTVDAHVGNAIVTEDGKTMYYTQCKQDEFSRMRCNIFKSTFVDGGWIAGEKLNANVNAEGATTTHPAFGKNEAGEDVLYFATDRNNGKGMDIYYAKLNSDGTFGKGKPVSPTLNTRGDDTNPWYDFKTNTLYFSSNGHVTIGGSDVFRSKVFAGEWNEPENLGTPVNSSVDDLYFRWSEEKNDGFVVSNRPGGFGQRSETCCDDIYAVQKNRLYFAVKGKLLDSGNNSALITEGIATLYDDVVGKELKSYYITNGSYFFDLDPERSYKVMIKKKGYDEPIASFTTQGKKMSDTTVYDFNLKPNVAEKKPGVGSQIGVVYWDYNKHILTDGSPDTLAKVVAFMQANPQYVLEVGSHTDSKGDDKYNMELSKRRSDAVLKFLTSKKIPKQLLKSQAYGETKPVLPNENPDGTDNPEGRTKNRRTEFRIIEVLPLPNIK
jgi:outer membrane protein OmpA-like peptidoglycan-associated protein/tetratricopeptide (TPR) repeat protein